jgi:hypothetical protein
MEQSISQNWIFHSGYHQIRMKEEAHEGVKVDPNKIKAMMDWTIPKTLNNLRGFLGLIGYYRKFVWHYGRIATPLMTLTKKEAFSWTPEATKAFEQLKEVM